MSTYHDETTSPTRVKVIGVGGGGCHAINTMIHAGVEGVEFIAVHTDEQALWSSLALTKLQLGGRLTNERGAGANPEMGRRAALEHLDRIAETLEGADLVFVTAGMGGGTGTGAAPVIASMAKERGCLTVAAVTKPFLFEGRRRLIQAETGLRRLRRTVDTLITISCQRLLGAVGKRCSVRYALRMGNDVLRHAVQSIADLIRIPGVSTVDFADVHTLMSESGLARLGTSVAQGERRAAEAAEQAICCPWLEDSSIEDARGLLINITGGPDMTQIEVHEAASIIAERAHAEAQVVCGAVIDEQMQGEIRVTVIATGVGEPHARAIWPARLVPTSQPLVVPRHEAPGRAGEQGASRGDDPQEPVDEATSAERPVQGLRALRACKRVKPRLEAWMDGELDPAEHAEIRSHLESCRTCQQERARDQRLTRLVLAQLSATAPPPHLWRTIVQQIEQERQIGGDTPPGGG